MCECPIGLVECKYPKSCFKFCNSCIKRQMQDELDYIISEAEIKAYNQALDDVLSKVKSNHYLLSDKINSTDYGMFTCGMEQIVDELKR